jgi:hypothetical protein
LKDVVTKNSLPFLSDDICLLPGSSPIVRVEEAPSNSRRIFTGVDIMADMEAIWDVLTAYDTLQEVVPSLVKNEVVSLTGNGGARLSQVGGAKVLPGELFIFVWLFFFTYALLAVVYVSYVEDRFFNTPRLLFLSE